MARLGSARRLALLGAGGHAKMVIEAARSQGLYEPVVCLTCGASSHRSILGVAVDSESDQVLLELKHQGIAAFVAVGDNALRRKLCEKLERLGMELATIVAGNAYLSPSARIAAGTVLMPGSIVGADVAIGKGVIVNTAASVDHDCTLGDFVHLGPGGRLAGNVKLGEQAFLGVGASVIPETSVGACSVVGAGAVVVRHIPEHELWAGCPARMLKKLSAS